MKRLLAVIAVGFVVGLLVYFGVNSFFSNSTLRAWDNAGIVLGYLVTCLSVGAAVTAYFSRQAIQRWLHRMLSLRRFEGLGTDFDPLREKVEAIVIPVSRRQQPEWIMRHLRPKHVAFLFTEQSKDVTRELLSIASELAIEVVNGAKDINSGVGLTTPDDPLKSKEAGKVLIERILQLGIDSRRVFVDTTGGRVPMSIGLFQAAEEMGVSTIYIVGQAEGGIIKDPKKAEHGRAIFISDHTEDGQ